MSLKAKAIENYDKSILALEECLKIGKCHHSFRISKNHLALKTIKKRTVPLNVPHKSLQTNGFGKYDVDYETKDYGNAIKTIEKLILLTLNSKKI
jgi:hypothetical protein